ncbi:MAG TPA: DUF502 domain-containing protein [Candidatus Desulfaltia sp.]|nr:DUF502 domain-containing protein [Candidatus Desulfaltia sp.]
MKRSPFKHIGTHVFRGLLAIIPLGLSYLVVRFFYLAIDARITGKIERWIGYRIPGLGFLLVLIALYLLGLTASNWAGRRAFGLIERISSRIPLVKTIYTLGKQLADALSLPEKQAFKRVVMVEHFRPGVWSIGFVTATIPDTEEEGHKLLRLFIPTAPNPTSGFVVTVKESLVKETHWSVPEAMNLILSGGMVGPEKT